MAAPRFSPYRAAPPPRRRPRKAGALRIAWAYAVRGLGFRLAERQRRLELRHIPAPIVHPRARDNALGPGLFIFLAATALQLMFHSRRHPPPTYPTVPATILIPPPHTTVQLEDMSHGPSERELREIERDVRANRPFVRRPTPPPPIQAETVEERELHELERAYGHRP